MVKSIEEIVANMKPKAGMEEKAEKAEARLRETSKLSQATQELAAVENLPTRVYANYRRLAKKNRFVANAYLEDWGNIRSWSKPQFCEYCGSAQGGLVWLRVRGDDKRTCVHIRCWEQESKDVN